MNKRILTLVLALVMVFGLAATAFAAPEVEKITNPKVQWLIDKNIVEGRLQDDGKTKVFDLDKTITREEVAKLVILYKGSENLARSLKGTKGIFSDVAIDRWSNGYINTAALDNLIIGYPDKTFKPEGEITYAEVAAILVRMNKKWTAADEKAAVWPSSFMKAAEQFGILKDVKIEDANAKAIRERVFEMMYNAFDGTYQAPIVNDKLGVVSRVWVDGIQLNGKDEFKVTRDTVFVGSDLNNLYKADDFYGALVRIALNKDNEITHIVILGNNGIAQPIARWNGIAEKGVIKDTAPAANLSNASNDEIKFDMADGILTVTDKTRIFVADKGTKSFYEAKKVEDAIKIEANSKHYKEVYAAYDEQPVTGTKVARVIVFAHGKELKANKDLVRITNNVNSSYKFMAENTKAVEKEYDISKYEKTFPANYGFEKMDVVKLTREGENGVSKVEKFIDYSEDPVFEVTELGDIRYNNDGTATFVGNSITLKDKDNREAEFALTLDGVSVFTNGLAKGAHVQIHFEDKDNKIIDVISKVDVALKGKLPRGEYIKTCGTLEDIFLVGGAHEYVSFVVDGRSYHAPVGAKIELKNMVQGCGDCTPTSWTVPVGSLLMGDFPWPYPNCPEEDDIDCLMDEGYMKSMGLTRPIWGPVNFKTFLIGKEICFLKDNAHDSDKYIFDISVDADMVETCKKFAEDYRKALLAKVDSYYSWLYPNNQISGPSFTQGETIDDAMVIQAMKTQLESIDGHPDFIVTKAKKVPNDTDQWDIFVQVKLTCDQQIEIFKGLLEDGKLPVDWRLCKACLNSEIPAHVLRVTVNQLPPQEKN